MQGKREVIQQSGGHSARTRLNGPRQARPPRGDDAGEDRSRPPRLAAARGEATGKCSGGPARKGGRGGGGGGNPSFVDDESREVRRGGRRWRGVAWTGSSVDRMGRRLQPKRAWGPRREPATMIGAWAFREPASQPEARAAAPAIIYDWYRWMDR